MNISDKTAKELLDLSKSDSMRKDMQTVSSQRHNPFLKYGKVDVDAYIEFLSEYNEFINHEPKPFRPIEDKIMRL
jgi:hypothetical protein